MDTYYVDSDMMGGDWRGEMADLRDFCDHLQTLVDLHSLAVEIEAVTDSTNGAKNDDPETIPAALWLAAVKATPARLWAGYEDDTCPHCGEAALDYEGPVGGWSVGVLARCRECQGEVYEGVGYDE